MKFQVDTKTGFSTTDKELLIYDKSMIPFYFISGIKNLFRFNLPLGTYYTENKITQLDKPCYYSSPKVPEKYFFDINYPENFKIIYRDNPNKCSVDLEKATIIFDTSYKKEPRFVRDFIKFHELGHFDYTGKGDQSERDCDLFAGNCMLKIGYNPTQIAAAQKYSLGQGGCSDMRKKSVANYLKRTKHI